MTEPEQIDSLIPMSIHALLKELLTELVQEKRDRKKEKETAAAVEKAFWAEAKFKAPVTTDEIKVRERYPNYTDAARALMRAANQEALRFNHCYLGTEHILLAAMITNVEAILLFGLDRKMVQAEIEALLVKDNGIIVMGMQPLIPNVTAALRYAKEVSGENPVDAHHIIYGIYKVEGGVARAILDKVRAIPGASGEQSVILDDPLPDAEPTEGDRMAEFFRG